MVESRARFNEVPEKVPEGFGAELADRRRASVESRARFSEVPEKVLEKVPEGLGAARFNEASSRFRCDSGTAWA